MIYNDFLFLLQRSTTVFNGLFRPALLILVASFILAGCSKTPAQSEANTDNTASNTVNQPAVETIQFDTTRPTNYAEYKRWRQANDPSGEAYANYKEWEIRYREWQERNQAATE